MRSVVARDVTIFVAVIVGVVDGGEDVSGVLLDDEEFETLLEATLLVAIVIVACASRRQGRGKHNF